MCANITKKIGNNLFINIILSSCISFLGIISVYIFSYDAFAENSLSKSQQSIMLGKTTLGKALEYEISESKVEAALALSARLSGKYWLISNAARDSVAERLMNSGAEPNLKTVADSISADLIAFVSVNRLCNMLRFELNLVERNDIENMNKGIGYSYLRFRDVDLNTHLFDPSLLQASQRALAAATGDSAMYEGASGYFKVFPAMTMVVGGIAFENDKALPNWKIFNKREINSYDLAENIFDEARKSEHFAVYDIETRDSIYAMFKMYGVENCNPPTINEIEALRKLEIQRFIAGTLARKPDGATVELYLCNIEDNKFEILLSEKSFLAEDSMPELKKIVRALTRKLLNIKD